MSIEIHDFVLASVPVVRSEESVEITECSFDNFGKVHLDKFTFCEMQWRASNGVSVVAPAGRQNRPRCLLVTPGPRRATGHETLGLQLTTRRLTLTGGDPLDPTEEPRERRPTNRSRAKNKRHRPRPKLQLLGALQTPGSGSFSQILELKHKLTSIVTVCRNERFRRTRINAPHSSPLCPPGQTVPSEKNPAAVALGRLGGIEGKARAESLSKKRRKEIARKAAETRWKAMVKK